jgi:protein-L-isoaspartate(D-aspartate) O-methyltransferase
MARTVLGAGLALCLLVVCSRPNGRDAPSHSDAPSASSAPASAPKPAGTPGAGTPAAAFTERQAERDELVRAALAGEGIDNPDVLAAMRRVPRHRFVPEAVQADAYADRPLPIGWGQTISQPYVVAAMTQAAAPKKSDRCLEIGTGSGYQAAVLAELCARTHSIEYVPELAAFGAKNLRALGYAVEVRTGDGYLGWPEASPFDVILVTAAPERVPPPLLEQLAVGGRLVIPVGPERGRQALELWTRRRPGAAPEAFERRELLDVRFVPFVGDRADGDRPPR